MPIYIDSYLLDHNLEWLRCDHESTVGKILMPVGGLILTIVLYSKLVLERAVKYKSDAKFKHWLHLDTYLYVSVNVVE